MTRRLLPQQDFHARVSWSIAIMTETERERGKSSQVAGREFVSVLYIFSSRSEAESKCLESV